MSTPQITADRVRIAVVQTSKDAVADIISGNTPVWYNGNDLQFEIAFFTDVSLGVLDDISTIDSITLQIKPLTNRRGNPVMSATLASGSLNAGLTLAQWQANDPTLAQAIVTFDKSLTVLSFAGDSNPYWLVLSAVLTSGAAVTLATGQVTVVETGFNTEVPSFVVTPTYYTAAQSDARYTVSSTKVSKAGDTMSGPLVFSGTTNAGIKLNNLTTAQRNALTGAAGMAVYDTTIGSPMFYTTAWKQPVTSINTLTGDVTLTTTNVAQGSNLYMTNTGVTGQPLTGLAGGFSAITATDTILQALSKLAAYSAAATGSGTVTSVALSLPAMFTVSGSPVTTTGTLTAVLANQAASAVLIGPTTSTAAPTFRVLAAGDIPALPESAITNLTTDLAAKLPLAGGTMTAPIILAGYAGFGAFGSASAAMLAYNTSTSLPAYYNGAAWVDIVNPAGIFAALAGATFTGAVNIVAGTPTGANATRADYVAATYAALAGGTFTGPVAFSGAATTFRLPNLTTTQRTAIGSPTAGMMVYDTTINAPMIWNGSLWQNTFATGSGGGGNFIPISGTTASVSSTIIMSGGSQFVANNVTDAQQSAISALSGSIMYNSSHGRLQYFDGAAWQNITIASSTPNVATFHVGTQAAAFAPVTLFTTPNDATNHMWRITGHFQCTGTGTSTIHGDVLFTDIAGNVQTLVNKLSGGTVALASTSNQGGGEYSFMAQPNTNIQYQIPYSGSSGNGQFEFTLTLEQLT